MLDALQRAMRDIQNKAIVDLRDRKFRNQFHYNGNQLIILPKKKDIKSNKKELLKNFPTLNKQNKFIFLLNSNKMFKRWYESQNLNHQVAIQSAFLSLQLYPEGRLQSFVTSIARQNYDKSQRLYNVKDY